MTIRKLIILSLVVVTLIVMATAFMLASGNKWTAAERKRWKNEAIASIEEQLRAGPPTTRPADADWAKGNTIVLRNGDWIAARSICSKEDARIADIFVGRGSDGQWYFSTFHFCADRVSLQAEGPADSLAQFVDRYWLRPFDGRSDMALQPTWNVK